MSKGILALSDGQIFYGNSVGANGWVSGEMVFNTSMTGYQEILSDPSYFGQIITFTSPHIGNVGINSEDMESPRIWAKGVVIREISHYYSNWRGRKTLGQFLKEQNIIALTGLDTRQIVRIIREMENLSACIVTSNSNIDIDFALQKAKFHRGVRAVECLEQQDKTREESARSSHFRVMVIDCGVKNSILTSLYKVACVPITVSYKISFEEINKINPDGILISNGPGDPRHYKPLIELTKKILAAKIPLFGICLGHQILALACGAKVFKMPFGQHGANHPIIDERDNRILICSQNHNYVVSREDLPKHLKITYRSFLNNTINGLTCTHAPAFGFQGHPESGPGPTDCFPLFLEFKELMQKHNAKTH